ncbi:hypothetical protein Hanom_Chr06g00533131 [Helianthus anomalus]
MYLHRVQFFVELDRLPGSKIVPTFHKHEMLSHTAFKTCLNESKKRLIQKTKT